MDQQNLDAKDFGDVSSNAMYYKPGVRKFDFDTLCDDGKFYPCKSAAFDSEMRMHISWLDHNRNEHKILSTRAVESAAKREMPGNPDVSFIFVRTESGSVYCFRNAQLNKEFVSETVKLKQLNLTD